MSDTPQDYEPRDFGQIGTRWPAWLVREFDAMRPVAVWVGGSRVLVNVETIARDGSRTRIGTNDRPIRAVRLGWSGERTDRVSPRLNIVPYFEQRMLTRLWVPNVPTARRVMVRAVELLTDQAEPVMLQDDWIALPPEYPIERLGLDLVAAAQDCVVPHWSDHALAALLVASGNRRRHAEARARGTRSGSATRIVLR